MTSIPAPRLRISTDLADMDLPLVHGFLSQQSAWAWGIPLATLRKAMANSLCFGGFLGTEQIAFARVVTDRATFANLVDVFVLPGHRGHGHSKALLLAVLHHPDLQGLRRFTLATRDAHALYAQFGFTPPLKPETLMERYFPDVYNVPPGSAASAGIPPAVPKGQDGTASVGKPGA